ncbi:MAG: hypothetical protein QOF18_2208 [Frankiaceae bacterium]|jgi:hypothetical protein|nr:hypothetical protein [Frankiaceae bacterium]
MTTVAALQAALGVEHEVIYGYGVVGAHLSGRLRARCLRRLDEHSARRDQLALLVRRAGAIPVAARPAYALPYPVADVTSAARLAARLEDAVAGAAWDLVTASGPATAPRRLGVSTLEAAATAAGGWRVLVPGTTDPALPGQPG